MNCKPGDIAISTAQSLHPGRMVEILYAAPYESFKLPDGYWNVGATEPSWVIRLLDGPMLAPLEFKGRRTTWYGTGPDRFLKPIEGIAEECAVSIAATEGK